METLGSIYLLGVNHACASIELREKLAFRESNFAFANFGIFSDRTDELALLSTCNRVEVLAYSKNPEITKKILRAWSSLCGAPEEIIEQNAYCKEEKEAVEHLFNTASSLGSMVLGEAQILGQMKEAYRRAVREGTSKTILNKLFHRAFFTAKEVRTKTRIGQSSVSVSHVAVDAAKRIMGNFSGKTALIVGAGEMACLAATYLKSEGCSGFVHVNRTEEKAQEMAAETGGETLPLSNLGEALGKADLVVCSSSAPSCLLYPEMFPRNRKKQILCIDIAMPRDIAPEVRGLPGITVMDLDDIQAEVDKNKQKRASEIEKALAITRQQALRFMGWKNSLLLQPTIVDLFEHTQKLANDELKKTLRKIGPVDAETEEALRLMLSSVLKKINHAPVSFIKSLQKQHGDVSGQISLLRSFFNLDE